MIWIFRVLSGVVLWHLASCASMSKQECITANWQSIGYEDGSSGRPEITIQAHRKACAKINITPDLAQYQRGHREGARVYCKNTQMAYRLGTEGGAYYNVCPADLEQGFLNAYRLGQELFAINRKIDDIEGDISSFESSIDSLEQQKLDQENALTSLDKPSKSQKRQYWQEITRLESEIHRYQDDINRANRDIGYLESEYAQLQAEHRRLGY